MGERPASILRHFQRNAGKKGYPIDPPDRATISGIRLELNALSPEAIAKLSTEVQAYAVSRRPGLKAELEQPNQERLGEAINWIEAYQAKYGKLPVLPKPLQGLAGDSDQPVSKDTVTYYANIGQWNAIKGVPRLEKKWREFLEWKGEDPDEYEYEVRRRGPPRGPGPIQLTYKRPRPR